MEKIIAFLKKDIVMWLIYILIIILATKIYLDINLKKQENERYISEIQRKIRSELNELKEENKDFDYPYNETFASNKGDKKAEKIEIKDFEINKNYTEANYIMKNNYDFDIFLMPEIQNELEKTGIILYLYDFDKPYLVLKPGEEKEFKILISNTVSSKIRKKDFVMYRPIYKNEEGNNKKEYLGYIELKEN